MTTRSAKDRDRPMAYATGCTLFEYDTRRPIIVVVLYAWLCFQTWNGAACDQANRAISTSKLNALLRLHAWPIDGVVFPGSQAKPSFEVSFPLRCFQRLSIPYLATRLCHWRDNRSTRDTFLPVLSY